MYCVYARAAGDVEWFGPAPRLTHTVTHTGFLALEVECKYPSLKRHVTGADDATTSSDDDDDVTDDDDDLDLLSRSARYVKHGLYYVTDIERFQPPRKKPRLVARTYRLLGLKSTTPEELYTRKVTSSHIRVMYRMRIIFSAFNSMTYNFALSQQYGTIVLPLNEVHCSGLVFHRSITRSTGRR